MNPAFEDLYKKAREENWTMGDGRPVTIGWIFGYANLNESNPYPKDSLAWRHWTDGNAHRARQKLDSILELCWEDD